jgi:N-acetylneuraminate synthase
VGPGHPAYLVAEMSANHHQSLEQAEALVRAAKDAGADAVKLQTYTPSTITLDCDNEHFQIRGTPWAGRKLFDLYGEAFTPWEWHPRLKKLAEELGLHLFSSPFDETAVDFLETQEVPVYKVASFEIVDLPLIRKIARTRRPMIVSTGMATLEEIGEAVNAIREEGGAGVALLKCTSAYPAPPEQMNLRTIPNLAETFGVPVGLSDHTLGISAAVTAVALGACMIEKHFTLSRRVPGPDSAFSLEPSEFRELVDAVRTAEKALGEVRYGPTSEEEALRAFRPSLFVVKDVKAGEAFTSSNVQSIRPGAGLPPKHLDQVLTRRAACSLQAGTPLRWEHLAAEERA